MVKCNWDDKTCKFTFGQRKQGTCEFETLRRVLHKCILNQSTHFGHCIWAGMCMPPASGIFTDAIYRISTLFLKRVWKSLAKHRLFLAQPNDCHHSRRKIIGHIQMFLWSWESVDHEKSALKTISVVSDDTWQPSPPTCMSVGWWVLHRNSLFSWAVERTNRLQLR